MLLITDLLDYVDSLYGATIRGRTVIDTDVSLQGDYSGKITLTLVPPHDEPDAEATDLVWHFDDVRVISPSSAKWEFWDEFDERTERETRS